MKDEIIKALPGLTAAMGDVAAQLAKLDRDAGKVLAGFDKLGDRLARIRTAFSPPATK